MVAEAVAQKKGEHRIECSAAGMGACLCDQGFAIAQMNYTASMEPMNPIQFKGPAVFFCYKLFFLIPSGFLVLGKNVLESYCKAGKLKDKMPESWYTVEFSAYDFTTFEINC